MFVIEGVSEDVKHSILCRERRTWLYFPQRVFTSRNQYQPMGLLLANHVIEQDRRQYDQSF